MVCNIPRSQLFQYLDGELPAGEQSALESHVALCADCRRLVEAEWIFRERYLRPLRPDPVPPAVRDGVVQLLDSLRAPPPAGGRWPRPSRRAVCVAVGLALFGGILGMALPHLGTRWSGSNATLIQLAEASVEQHQKLTRGILPLDITHGTPKVAEQWFRRRLDFNVNLPELSTQADLTFQGGRISHLEDFDVAALRYQVDGADVSLFIMPVERYRQLGLQDSPKFKTVTYQGYDVIVWTSHGGAYSLVSEIGGRSCLVCHAPTENVDIPTGSRVHGNVHGKL